MHYELGWFIKGGKFEAAAMGVFTFCEGRVESDDA
jgi:hypothetical protein